MFVHAKTHLLAGFLALAVIGSVHAQFNYNQTSAGIVARTQARVAAPWVANNASFNYRPAAWGYRPGGYGYGGYGYNPYGWNPYPYYGAAGGYLNGAANLYNSIGQMQVQTAQANQINEQVRQSKLDTRKQVYDQYRYEQSMKPTYEDTRAKEKMNEVRRAHNDPPQAEIWSGAAMNTLLKEILSIEGQTGLRGPEIPLNPDFVKRLNVVVTGTADGSVSLIQAQQLQWPPALLNDDFNASRTTIETMLPKAEDFVRQGGGGKNEPLQKMLAALGDMKHTLDADVDKLTPDDWIGGNRFINQLRDSAKMLQKPNAANYFNGKWTASGRTVGELVYNMGQKGLSFAPCAEGDEDAYNVVYRQMLNYDAGLSRYSSGR